MPVPFDGEIARRKVYLVTEEVHLVFPSVQAPKARRSVTLMMRDNNLIYHKCNERQLLRSNRETMYADTSGG
jgi:hypothetical protein